MTLEINRRSFLAATGAALVVPILPVGMAQAQTAAAQLNPFLRLEPDGIVTLLSPVSEMGQGTHTGHAQIAADELGVDIAAIRVIVPDQPAAPYRLPFGQCAASEVSASAPGSSRCVSPRRRPAAC